MFKRLSLLLVSLFMIPTVLGSFSYTKENDPVVSHALADGDGDENVLHGYTYTDETYEDSSAIIRHFHTKDLTPTINKHFCAPTGYTFSLSIEDWQINEILDQAEFAGANFNLLVDLIYYYSITGNYIYSDSNPHYGEGRDNVFDEIKNTLNGFVLFKATEIKAESTLKLLFIFEFYTDDDQQYQFYFESDPIVVRPYNEFDFLNIRSFYYERREVGERRVTVYVEPIEGFFYESPVYNNYGFHTDTVNGGKNPQTEENVNKADYELLLIANDTIELQDISFSHATEMGYPTEPFEVKAKLRFRSGGVEYTYYSQTLVIADPNMCVAIDGYPNCESIQKNSEYEFSFDASGIVKEDIESVSVYIGAYPYRLNDSEDLVILYDSDLPTTGQEGICYYVPTNEEKEAHQAGKDSDFADTLAQGNYYVWDKETSSYTDFFMIELLQGYYFVDDEYSTLDSPTTGAIGSLPYAGKWGFSIDIFAEGSSQSYSLAAYDQLVKVISDEKGELSLSLKFADSTDVPDNVNLIAGGGSIEIVPFLASTDEQVGSYYDYEISREGVVNVEEEEDNYFKITAINPGVTTLTIYNNIFASIKKEINIHVLDAVYDVAQIESTNEFHYAGNDLTVYVNIRGFTNFQNLEIDWTIIDKKGEALTDAEYRDNNDASVTILNPKSNDYTVTAQYNGVEIGTITIQVRKLNINKFIRQNIWWIFLITVAMVCLILFLRSLTRRGRTTVQTIQRAYDVYCACLSDDKLTKEELIRIKREITRCKNRCEDLNIEALNQYEKAIRYLRKSLNDSKELLSKWDEITPEDKSVYADRLDKDLSKALNVAREIEDAKDLIEKHHVEANRQNYEVLKDDEKDGKK